MWRRVDNSGRVWAIATYIFFKLNSGGGEIKKKNIQEEGAM